MDEIGGYTEKGVKVQIQQRATRSTEYRWKLKYDITVGLPNEFTGGGWNEQ